MSTLSRTLREAALREEEAYGKDGWHELMVAAADEIERLNRREQSTPPAPLTLHVLVWPVSEDTPKDRDVMLLVPGKWFAGLGGGWCNQFGAPEIPTHFTELKYMALPEDEVKS